MHLHRSSFRLISGLDNLAKTLDVKVHLFEQ